VQAKHPASLLSRRPYVLSLSQVWSLPFHIVPAGYRLIGGRGFGYPFYTLLFPGKPQAEYRSTDGQSIIKHAAKKKYNDEIIASHIFRTAFHIFIHPSTWKTFIKKEFFYGRYLRRFWSELLLKLVEKNILWKKTYESENTMLHVVSGTDKNYTLMEPKQTTAIYIIPKP